MSALAEKLPVSFIQLRTGAFALFGLAFVALAIPAFAEPMTFWTGIVYGDYLYPTHELHHFVLGSILSILLLGVVLQALWMSRRVAALHSSILIWIFVVSLFTIGGAFSGIQILLLGLLCGMAVVHPLGMDQLPRVGSLDRPLAILAGLTAVAGLVLAGIELNAQLTVVDGHAGFDHYLFMAITYLSISGMALLGSFRPIGWRFPIYASSFLILVIGIASIVYPGPEQGSSLGVALGALAVIWAILLLGVAERNRLLNDGRSSNR